MGLFDKLFGKKEELPTVQSLDTPISEIKKDREGYINLGQSIFPAIKSVNDPKLKIADSINPLVMDSLCEGLVTSYVIDLEDKLEMISQSHLEKLGLTKQDVRDVALRNLTKKVQSGCKIGMMDYSRQNPNLKPFHKIDMDEDFNATLLCLESFWEQPEKILKSDRIAVCIPAKNLLLLTDMRNLESLISMRVIAAKMYERATSDGTAITSNTYIRKNGQWILFLDTEEQVKELLR